MKWRRRNSRSAAAISDRRIRQLDLAQQQEDQKDQNNQAQSSARVIPKAGAVGPSRQKADQQNDQNDEQQRACGTLHNGTSIMGNLLFVARAHIAGDGVLGGGRLFMLVSAEESGLVRLGVRCFAADEIKA